MWTPSLNFWPFYCKECDRNLAGRVFWKEMAQKEMLLVEQLKHISLLEWIPICQTLPPINTNLLVASKDFTWLGFLFMEDGWDYSRKINMFYKDRVWATYTNADSVAYWLNLDLISKGEK
jgi:hypothetical protein